MANYLQKVLYKKFPIDISEQQVKQINLLTKIYETRGSHSLALNTSSLAVHQMLFLDVDNKNLFDLFNIDRKEFKSALGVVPGIDFKKRIVISDPYNNLTVYLCHRVLNSNLDIKLKNQCFIDLMKMLHYKFFTSFVNYMMPFGANEATMKASIEKLTNKSDIIKHGTWKKVIEHRCENILFGKIDTDEDRKSIHIDGIRAYDNDDKIFYTLSDTQTRLRNKLKLIFNEYHKNHQIQETIDSYSLTSEIDGKKNINDTFTLESMITSVSNQVLNTNTFVDNNLIQLICSMFSNLKMDMFRAVLIKFSEIALIQSKSGKLDYVVYDKDREMYIGTRILIANLIQKTYRFCIKNNANMKNKKDILIKTKNLYSASRINDPEILDIKDSVHNLVIQIGETRRDATIVSIKIAFILYIMIKTFDYL